MIAGYQFLATNLWPPISGDQSLATNLWPSISGQSISGHQSLAINLMNTNLYSHQSLARGPVQLILVAT